jgi:Tfp pilus assembly protein PilF
MAKKTAALPQRPNKKPQRRRLRRSLIALAVLVTLGLLGFAVFESYRRVRRERIISRARTFLEKQDSGQAALSLRRALQVNPRDVEANRMMAVLAEKSGAKQAIYWRRAVAEFEPGMLNNHLAWAETALRFNEPTVAEQALIGVSDADKKSAVYSNMAGRVALTMKQPQTAGAYFAEAVRLEPKNEQYQLDLAALRLSAGESEARVAVERLAANPALRRTAQRALYQDALKRSDSAAALALARQLQSSPDAPFEDQMLYLGLLRQLHRREFDGYLSDLQEQTVGNADHVAALITWLKDNGMALVAVDWSKRLPEEIRTRLPVPPALGESYAALHDWSAVNALIRDAKWDYAEFVRLALLARVQREEGDELGSRNQWNAAVKAASDRPEALVMLARYGTAWGWETETNDLLWIVARGATNQQWALQALLQTNSTKRNARGLLSVATRTLELDPQDTAAQNNFALLSLLLNTNMDRALIVAQDAYQKHTDNPAVASTYAFALHLRGDTEEGLKIMRSIDEKLLLNPSYAAYYGVLLAAGGDTQEAARFLDAAQRGHGQLLPEEQAIVAKARKGLPRSANGDTSDVAR